RRKPGGNRGGGLTWWDVFCSDTVPRWLEISPAQDSVRRMLSAEGCVRIARGKEFRRKCRLPSALPLRGLEAVGVPTLPADHRIVTTIGGHTAAGQGP